MHVKARVFEFGPFELDTEQQELRRRGIRLKIAPSRFRLLTLFVSRHGQLITRDQIAECLWKDVQTVDMTSGINTAVNQLRAQLGDDPSSPRYIETVIGFGYRFIASVRMADEAVEEPAQERGEVEGTTPAGLPQPMAEVVDAADVEPVHTVAADQVAKRAWSLPGAPHVLAGMLLGVTLLSLAIFFYWRRSHVPTPSGEDSNGPPSPANLFFLQSTFDDDDDIVTAEAVSPDGEQVAYNDDAGITIRSLSFHSERLTARPPSLAIRQIAWDEVRRRLLVSGVAETVHTPQIWAVSLDSDEAKLLMDNAAQAAVSPDGSRILFTRNEGNEVWIAGASGENSRRLTGGSAGESFPFATWAPSGSRIILARRSAKRQADRPETVLGNGHLLEGLEQQYRWSYQSIDVVTGKLLAVSDDLSFNSGYVLPDGRFFFLSNEQDLQKKGPKIMAVKTDPATGRLLGTPEKALSLDGEFASALSASADGRQVAYILRRSSADVFVANLNVSRPALTGMTRLTHHLVNNFPHAFTPDGNAVVFENGNPGRSIIARQRLGSGAMESMARLDETIAMPAFSPDGRWLLFLGFSGRPSRQVDALYRVPANGGKPEKVPMHGTIEEFHCPVARTGTCVVRMSEEHKQLVYYELDPVVGIGRELARTAWEPNVLGEWSLSPDSATVAIARHDPSHPAVRLLRFAPGGLAKMTELPVEGYGTILGATWSQDGHGLFVQSHTHDGYLLLYVTLQGRVSVLRQSAIPIWAVPSPDGKKLAFPGMTVSTNLWTISDAASW